MIRLRKAPRKKSSLYRKLLCSYVLFSLLVVLLFSGCLLLVSAIISRGNFSGLAPYTITNAKSCKKGLPGILNLNGWIEELDSSYQVKRTMGKKKTAKKSYTPDELFRLVSPNGRQQQHYIGFLNERTDSDGYFLVILGRTEIQITTTILYGPDNSNPIWSRMFLTVFFGLFALMCALMSLFLNRRIKKPLNVLTEGMKRVREGERGIQLHFRTEAEFAEIRDTFNVMSRTLETAMQEKEAAEQKKNKMLLELSHDIRTPLATINSYAVALEQDIVSKKELKRYYGVIRRKAERVTLLADELFTMLKMQSSEYELTKTKDDICEFVRRECAEYYEDASEKGLDMTIAIPDEGMLIDADFSLLKRMMGNLLSNAIKYNLTGSEISITLYKSQKSPSSSHSPKAESNIGFWIYIEIADDGLPISQELKDRLFDDFVRGDRSRKSDGGAGLGLAISKAIAEKHGGSIGYRYESGKNRFLAALPQTF